MVEIFEHPFTLRVSMKQALAAFVGLLASMASAQQAADAECACLTASQLSSVEGWSDAKFVDSDGMKKVTLSGITYTYPALYGLENCAAHDATQKPYCDAADPPEWCADRWCYVDHTNCKYPAVKSSYFAGVDLRYSYTTCGSKNTFDAWFDENAAASGAHAITDIVDVLTGYLTSIVNTIEANQKEVAASGGSCDADLGCDCETCKDNALWKNSIDVNTATVHLPNRKSSSDPMFVGVDQAAANMDVCLAGIATDSFTRIAAKEANVSRIGYEYYGSQSIGAYMGWPGLQWCLDEYDPRFRPWYATAASGPKDVVIVVDSSGSMSSGDRIEMAKEAATKVIDTLSSNDYVNVIDFASSAKAYSSRGLVKADATVTGKDSAMKTWVDNIRASGSTNFRDAFNTAFDLFRAGDASRSSGCNKVILFLTDGKPDDWSEDDFRSVREASAELDVHLLTYALGSGADFDRVKRLACENKGIAQKVEDAQDDRLANAMASYYQMLGPMLKPCQTRWVGYTDILSGEYLLTGCMAAFETLDGSTATSCEGGLDGLGEPGDKRVPHLLGVGCIDMNLIVDINVIQARDDWGDFEARINSEMSACPRITLTELQLETLRVNVGPESVCDAAAYEAAAVACSDQTDEETCGAQGDCSWDGSSCLQAESNVGAIVGGAVGGAVGLALLLLIIACACKKKKPKAQMPKPRANSVVVQGVPMGTVPTGTAV